MKKITVLILILTILVNMTSFGKATKKTNSDVSVQNQETLGSRYGSKNVGYVTKPSDWFNFMDSNSSPNTIQITPDGVNIVTLDIIFARGQATSNEVALAIQEKYLNSGIENKNISLKDTSINGYKGKKVKINFPDGTLYIVNCIDYNGNIYLVAQEGLSEYQNKLLKVIDTWNPSK